MAAVSPQTVQCLITTSYPTAISVEAATSQSRRALWAMRMQHSGLTVRKRKTLKLFEINYVPLRFYKLT
jgi:hypothetical protein